MSRRFHRGDDNRGETNPGRNNSFAYRCVIAVATLLAGVAALWFCYKGLDVLLTLFGGIVMGVLLYTLSEPVMRWTKMPLWAAVLLVTLAIIGVLTAAGWLLAPSVSQQFDQLSDELPQAIDRVRADIERYKWTNWILEHREGATNGKAILQQATKVFTITLSAGAALAIVAFLAIYFAAQPKLYVEGMVRLFPLSYRQRAREVCAELYRTLRMFLLTKLISMAFVAVCVWLGLWALKVPLALALAILAGLLEFIPTIGPLLSAVPAVLLAFVHSPMTALYVSILYFAVQWVQNHVTNPLLQQKTLSLAPAVSLALVALLGALFGFGGLLLSGPLSVVVLVLVKMVYVEDALERRRTPQREERYPRRLPERGPRHNPPPGSIGGPT